MNQEDFTKEILDLLMPQDSDPDYEEKETEAVRLVKALARDATQKGGGKWNNDVGKECFTQFVWLHNQP